MNFDICDEKKPIQKNSSSLWGSNISSSVVTKLITEGCVKFNEQDLAIKGNDMETFKSLYAGPSPLIINSAPKSFDVIKDLIFEKKFIPFPPHPQKKYTEDPMEYLQLIQSYDHEEYPPDDGYENSRHLHVVASAILVHPDLVTYWKEIGYHEICEDVNDLVMRGVLLIFFPDFSSNNWVPPTVDSIVARLKQFVDLGFQLNGNIMEETFHLFIHRLDEIGDRLMDSFNLIHNESISDIASSCLIHAIKPGKNLGLLKFLFDRIDQPKEALMNAFAHYGIGFNVNIGSVKSINEMKSLTVYLNLYHWILHLNFEVKPEWFVDVFEFLNYEIKTTY